MTASRTARRRAGAALATAAAAACLACTSPAPAARPEAASAYACAGCNLLLVSIDTLRADHLGCYGYERPTSPTIDRLAAASAVFENAYSVSYHTAESHMSMFTSLYPSVHRVRNSVHGTVNRLHDGVTTLAAALAAAGWRTAGFHGGGNVARSYGFDRGFETYQITTEIDPAVAWLAAPPAEPFFLFVHNYRPHDPYTPLPPYDRLFTGDYRGRIVADRAQLDREAGKAGFAAVRDAFWGRVDRTDPRDLAHLRALYDGEIRQIDAALADLFAAAAATARPTVVVLVSDHGEEFGEHGGFLHDDLYEELLRVPLILHHPRVSAGRRVAPRVSLIDLAPTLLDVVGVPAPDQFQGESLLPVVEGRRTPGSIYAEKIRSLSRDARKGRPLHYALIHGDVKLILKGRPEVYDLAADPGERRDQTATSPELRPLRQLARRIEEDNGARRQSLGVPLAAPEEALDAEAVEQLRALGYLR
jgi:arylsulfatase A-like enzyme